MSTSTEKVKGKPELDVQLSHKVSLTILLSSFFASRKRVPFSFQQVLVPARLEFSPEFCVS